MSVREERGRRWPEVRLTAATIGDDKAMSIEVAATMTEGDTAEVGTRRRPLWTRLVAACVCYGSATRRGS